MREHILNEIRRLATENGSPPGMIAFSRQTGISDHQWLGKFWARWSEALAEAGFAPNQKQARLDSDAVLDQIIAACRHYGRLPTKAERDLFRKDNPGLPSNNAIARHFGRQDDLISALAKRADNDPAYADIAAMLPVARRPVRAGKTAEGFVYLIQSGAFYKIGRSDDLERRVKQITVALPDKATLVHSIRTDDPAGIEAYWHRRFADKRANGEWFKLTPLDLAAFKKRKFQ